jgi:copper chaperone NosL
MATPRSLVYLILLLLAMVASACGSSAPAEIGPPEIVLGEDRCVECGMIISDLRFAAAAVTPEGASLLFDDIGDMLRYRTRAELPEGTVYFVHDYDSREWLEADSAFYVQSNRIHSPMGSGVAAFALQARAEAMAAEQEGTIMDYASLLQAPLSHYDH